MAPQGLQASFKAFQLGLVHCFKDEISALADQVLRANPSPELFASIVSHGSSPLIPAIDEPVVSEVFPQRLNSLKLQ